MGKRYSWYNNGLRNIKIFEGEVPDKDLTKGYIILKDKTRRLKKLNDRYELAISEALKENELKMKEKIKKIEKELIEKQKKIYPNL